MNWLDFYNNLAVNTKNKICQNGAMFTTDKKIYQKIFDDINKKVRFKKDDIVLDIGCGNGEMAKFTAPLVKKIILLDGAPKMLTLSEETTADFKNTEFRQVDINKNFDFSVFGRLDKVLCYSVVHYLDSYERFENLLKEMILALNPGGAILVGDIPLDDKRQKYLEDRKNRPLLNFIGNLKHFLKKSITKIVTVKASKSPDLKARVFYNREKITATINKFKTENLDMRLVQQENNLPFFNSREDLLIIKNK